jgi:hypothetical protein
VDSTIIGALIGAAATILAAFISKDYAQRRVTATPPETPLDKPTITILRVLSALTVRSARVIRLKEKKVYVDQELGLVFLLNNSWNSWADIDISALDGQRFNLRFELGSVLTHDSNGTQYYLILTSASLMKDTAHIQVRRKQQSKVLYSQPL